MTQRAVLLLDDDAPRAIFVHDILVESGCDVEILLDSREATARLRRRAFQVIVVGPRLMGIGAARVIRRLRARAVSVPIVAISSAATPAAGERLIRAGAATWLPEPLTERRLRDEVEQFLEPRTESAPSPSKEVLA